MSTAVMNMFSVEKEDTFERFVKKLTNSKAQVLHDRDRRNPEGFTIEFQRTLEDVKSEKDTYNLYAIVYQQIKHSGIEGEIIIRSEIGKTIFDKMFINAFVYVPTKSHHA